MLRHSDAALDHDGDDHTRPLTQHGVELCQTVATTLSNYDNVPDYVVCSTATRTMQTAEHVLNYAGLDTSVDAVQKLYLASPEEMLQVIHTLPDDAHTVLLIGHNPGIHALCIELANRDNADAFSELASQFPSPALACFRCNVESWGLVTPYQNTLEAFHAF